MNEMNAADSPQPECYIQVLAEDSGGTTYHCITHNVVWNAGVFNGIPVKCPQGEKDATDGTM
jgi:hypothetical protein